MATVVVDADYIVYSCGFATERVRWDASVVRPSGATEEAIFPTKFEALAWLALDPLAVIKRLDRVVETEPLQNALHLVNLTINKIRTNLTALGVDIVEPMTLYITGKGNFRESLATIKGYKANRDPLHRPLYYRELRDFLRHKGAIEVEGYEADDAVAMEAAKHGYKPYGLVMVSVDKDLLTIPGSHYNFRTGKLLVVSEDEARLNFYRQLVTGDTVDNIGGAYLAGPVAAGKAIRLEDTEYQQYMAALSLYLRGWEIEGCPYAHMSAADALLENARLLWLRRSVNDVWVPPAPPSSGAPSSSESSASDSTVSLSPTDTKPVRSASTCLSRDIARTAEVSCSCVTPCIRPTSSSRRGRSRPKASSRRKTASESKPS